MNGSMVLLSLFFSVVLSEFVDPDESPPAQTPIRAHRLRPHHKRDTGQSCGTETYISDVPAIQSSFTIDAIDLMETNASGICGCGLLCFVAESAKDNRNQILLFQRCFRRGARQSRIRMLRFVLSLRMLLTCTAQRLERIDSLSNRR
ncbi:hypothetical protein ANCCAN_06358 [Ancylostoma caninum]|uniref:Secreted protein n=1 Tax=Ancylostoma caninum TaxID=29170 RepID=A0A368GTE2_ANCCA|nr:hypothetical protein ANCCAN_06358 [Ancylostoma caninum]